MSKTVRLIQRLIFSIMFIAAFAFPAAAGEQPGSSSQTPGAPGTLPRPAHGFDIDKFEQIIKAELSRKTVGYAYAIAIEHGPRRAGAGGFAILPDVAQSPDRRIDILSMSKTITATTVMRAIEDLSTGRGRPGLPALQQPVSLDSPILRFLPKVWQQAAGPNVDKITIRDLLTHSSGLVSLPDENSFASLGQTILNGATNAAFHHYNYQNCNFSLFRIIVPYMLNARATFEPLVPQTPPPQETYIDDLTSNLFAKYVREQVFARVPGLTGADLAPDGEKTGIRYYDFQNPKQYQVGHTYDYNLHRAGPGFFFLSANELLNFLIALQRGEIISKNGFKLMQSNALGMGVTMPPNSTPVPTWNHNGGFGGVGGGGGGDWMILGDRLTAVVVFNSANSPQQKGGDVLFWEAYNAAVY